MITTLAIFLFLRRVLRKPFRKVWRKFLWLTAPAGSRMRWVTFDDRRMDIRDMTDGHLLNTIRFLYSRRVLNPWGWELARAMRAEASRRGLPDDATKPKWLAERNRAHVAALKGNT